jgi:hypothetical protein
MLFACLASVAAQAADQTYAWLEDDSQQAFVRLVRGGQPMAYSSAVGFAACDEVSLTSATTNAVAIATADGTRLVLDASVRRVKLPCDTRAGVGHDVISFMQALLTKSNKRVPVPALTRGAPGACSHDLGMALLSPGEDTPTMVSSDSRPLVLAWTGSARPFSVQIDSPRGTMLHVDSLQDNLYWADIKSFAPGRYRLRLKDSCNQGLEDNFLQVVEPSELPAMPSQIASLPEPGRTIYYAEYLLGYSDGRWGLEALQLVARLPKTYPAAHAWITRWTSPQ